MVQISSAEPQNKSSRRGGWRSDAKQVLEAARRDPGVWKCGVYEGTMPEKGFPNGNPYTAEASYIRRANHTGNPDAGIREKARLIVERVFPAGYDADTGWEGGRPCIYVRKLLRDDPLPATHTRAGRNGRE